MSDYSAVHSRAVSLVTRKGVSVTFTKVTQTVSETDGSVSPTTTTVSGVAIQDSGSFREFLASGLITAQEQVLFFTPSTIGESPVEGMTCDFGDVAYTARRVFPLAPNGTIIASRVVVAA